MAKCEERFRNAPDAALFFIRELKAARLGALADAEGWMPLVLAFERLGKFLANRRKANLGEARDDIIELAVLGANSLNQRADRSMPIPILVGLVIDGRNEEFHGGSAARRFADHCLELGLILEDAIKSLFTPMKLKYVMTPNPTCAEPNLPIYHARRIMLENSFTWLPLQHMGKWFGLSDQAIVAYTAGDSARYSETIGTAIEKHAGPKLVLTPLTLFDEDKETSVVIEALKDRPVLIKAEGCDRHIGIITSFDLL